MNPLEQLRDDLQGQFPGISLEIDAPADVLGPWQLDVRPGPTARWIVVEWKPGFGFGVSTPDEADFGTKPDETYQDAESASNRVTHLIASGQPTEPPSTARLAEMRRSRPPLPADLAKHPETEQPVRQAR